MNAILISLPIQALLTIVTIVYLSLYALLPRAREGEPPFIKPSLTPLGHLVGMIRKNVRYLIDVNINRHSIFTLPFPTARVYVVADPRLLPEVDRKHQVLNFWAVESDIFVRLGLLSRKAKEIFRGPTFHSAFTKAHKSALGDPASLHDLIQSATSALLASLTSSTATRITEVDLWSFTRKHVNDATTSAVYGPANPYASPQVLSALIEYVGNTFNLMSGALISRLLFPSAYTARDRLIYAVERYISVPENLEKASALMRGKMHAMSSHGMSSRDIAGMEVSFVFGLVGNTAGMAFWGLVNVFQDSRLLDQVRQEAKLFLRLDHNTDGTKTARLDVDGLRRSALLRSVVYETIRCQSVSATVRMVKEDMVLGERWLLRKGSYMVLPAESLHSHAEAWGKDAPEFNAKRFLSASGSLVTSAFFRGFGGGPSMCPGRHFAIAQVSVILAAMVLRYNIRPPGGHGAEWKRPKIDESKMFDIMSPPLGDTSVDLELRDEWRDCEWGITMKGCR